MSNIKYNHNALAKSEGYDDILKGMNSLKGLKVLVTSGPTHEPLDPVRFLGNRSSGKQGHAIAEALRDAGAEVILVSGPVSIPDPKQLSVIKVTTAKEMLAACKSVLPVDIFISAAAVSDWRPKKVARQKIKKTDAAPAIELVQNPDILKAIARSNPRPKLVIGFAAETEQLEARAKQKRKAKGCDWMIANDVSDGKIFDAEATTVLWITADTSETWHGSKKKIAEQLTRKIIEQWT